MDEIVAAIKVVADTSLASDRALFELIQELIKKVERLEERVKELELVNYTPGKVN